MNKKYRDMIADEFRNCVLNTIKRLDNAETNRPFHAALLSDEALFWSRFERSFSTSFGQRVVEEISMLASLAGGAEYAHRQEVTDIGIDPAYDSGINAHMNLLREGKGARNWHDTLSEIKRYANNTEILNTSEKKYIQRRVTSDLWWYKDGINHYMSIKTVKPNIDQTAVAKQDMLRLTFAEGLDYKVHFGLYYNPYGEDRCSYAHNPPMRIFDFHNDEVVLIGKDYWDTLGGEGCYEIILDIAKKVGKDTKTMLTKLK
jgi:hypothetical protein